MKSRNQFAWLQASAGLSNLADGVFQVVVPLVTLGVTRNPILYASVMLAIRLPWLFFALPAGAIADRSDRRRIMVMVNVSRTALIGGLAITTGLELNSVGLLATAVFALGVGETLFDTSSQSILPAIVDPDDLARANGRLYGVELTLNQFIGPPLGGFLVGVGAGLALGGVAGAYLLAAGALLMVSGSFRPERAAAPQSLRADIAEGLRYLWNHRILRTLALLTGLANLTGSASFTVLALYAVAPGPMGLTPTGFGLLLAAMAVGSVGGTFAAAPAERLLGRWGAITTSFAFFIPGVGAAAFTSSGVIVGLSLAAMGAASVIWNVITVALRQRIVPDTMLGRINGSYRLVAWGTSPIGTAAGGVLTAMFGMRFVFAAAAIATAASLPLLVGLRTALNGDT